MPDEISARLGLPYLQPAQAQKHVTHNEALRHLDVAVQLTLVARDALIPPETPEEGAVFALGAAPQGDWAGHPGALAIRDLAAWRFIQPARGWQAVDLATGRSLVHDGSGWQPDLPDLQQIDGVGIGTGFDATNRLAVVSAASLFSHAGADHRMSLNKAGVADTVSLVFQSAWQGHAEIGLAGDKALSVKVSPDGATWAESLRIDPDAQSIALSPDGVPRARLDAQGLRLDVPLTGAAVQASPTEALPGRLLPVGAFGLGATDQVQTRLTVGNGALPNGFYCGSGGTGDAATFPDPNTRYNPFLTLNRRIGDQSFSIRRMFFSGSVPIVWSSPDSGASWDAPNRIYGTENLVGAVSQTAGRPTGAVVERGANANGAYVRHADGTQICWRTIDVTLTTLASGAVFHSAQIPSWIFPAAFANAFPKICGLNMHAADCWGQAGAITNSQMAGGHVWSAVALVDALRSCSLWAIGRWF